MIETPKQPKNFSIVCNEVARRLDLSARAKGIYYYLATLPNDWKLTQKEMYKHFPEGEKALRTAFNELIKKGYITRKAKKKGDGKFEGYIYKVLWTSLIKDTGLAKKGIPQFGQDRKGQALLNTKLLNIDLLNKEKELNIDIFWKNKNGEGFFPSLIYLFQDIYYQKFNKHYPEFNAKKLNRYLEKFEEHSTDYEEFSEVWSDVNDIDKWVEMFDQFFNSYYKTSNCSLDLFLTDKVFEVLTLRIGLNKNY